VLNNFQNVGFSPQQAITINVSPHGLTTSEAAKKLGDEIAANLTGQGVAIR